MKFVITGNNGAVIIGNNEVCSNFVLVITGNFS